MKTLFRLAIATAVASTIIFVLTQTVLSGYFLKIIGG